MAMIIMNVYIDTEPYIPAK